MQQKLVSYGAIISELPSTFILSINNKDKNNKYIFVKILNYYKI